ncbi:MAG TPA: flagellar motor switch protein FliM [Chthonomonadaceae bacterium]|nr:flagellar motor switch protein FliM [Chthonomonadaceae bacterium]
MAEIISHAEIQALLASLTGAPTASDGEEAAAESPSLESAPEPPPPSPPDKTPLPAPWTGARASGAPAASPVRAACEAYDFRRPDKLAKDQLRTLQMLHETFARMFASSLSAYMRVPVHVELLSARQMRYDEYMRGLTSSLINLFSLPPLAGQAILEIDFNVTLAMIDRLLGGPGSMIKKSTALTDIERALAESIVNRALKELRTAWEGVYAFTPTRELMETQGQFIQIAPPNDIVLSVRFDVEVGDLHGKMSLCLPYTLLKPITAKFSAQKWTASNTRSNAGGCAAVLARGLENTYVTCIAQLATAALSLDELMRLQVGDIVRLDRGQHDEIDIRIGQHVKFHGKPGTRGKKLAVHISRVAEESHARAVA